MAVQPKEEVRWGLVAEVITAFEHAVMLARGISAEEQARIDADPQHRFDKLREAESRTVPREDMEAAYEIAGEVRKLFAEWQSRYSTVRWPGDLEMGVRITMNDASAATKHLVEQTGEILQGAPPGAGQVRSLRGGWPLIWVRSLNAVFEPLQIIEGELLLADSALGRVREFLNEYYDALLTDIPVVGEVVMAYEAVIGYQVVGGRKLAPLEQVLTAVGLILPFAVSALVKAAPRIAIALRAFRVNLARRIPKSTYAQLERFTADMVIGLRSLPRDSFENFLKILRLVEPLSPRQSKDLAFFLSRLDYASRLAQWLRIIEKRVGKDLKGVHILMRPAKDLLKEQEPAMMEKLSRLSGKPVVNLPEMHPRDYEGLLENMAKTPKARMPQVKGVKYADTVWGGEFAELYQVELGTNWDAVRETIASKGKQASTLVVTNGPKSTVDLVSMITHRFWSWPKANYIDKVVILFENSYQVIERPARYISLDPKAYLITRAIVGDPAHLIRTAQEVEQAQEAERAGAKR